MSLHRSNCPSLEPVRDLKKKKMQFQWKTRFWRVWWECVWKVSHVQILRQKASLSLFFCQPIQGTRSRISLARFKFIDWSDVQMKSISCDATWVDIGPCGWTASSQSYSIHFISFLCGLSKGLRCDSSDWCEASEWCRQGFQLFCFVIWPAPWEVDCANQSQLVWHQFPYFCCFTVSTVMLRFCCC